MRPQEASCLLLEHDWEKLGADTQPGLGNVRTFHCNWEILNKKEHEWQIPPQSIQWSKEDFVFNSLLECLVLDLCFLCLKGWFFQFLFYFLNIKIRIQYAFGISITLSLEEKYSQDYLKMQWKGIKEKMISFFLNAFSLIKSDDKAKPNVFLYYFSANNVLVSWKCVGIALNNYFFFLSHAHFRLYMQWCQGCPN